MSETLSFLIIEDLETDYHLIRHYLRHQGLSARCRRIECLQGLEHALEEGGWDAVLSDYNVPGLDFRTGLKMIRSRLPELPVILVTSAMGEEQAIDLFKEGVWDFVLKDRPARLAPAIERSLREAAELRARRLAEQALRESEERLQLALRASGVVVWDWDIKSLKVRESGPIASLFGRLPGFHHANSDEFFANVHPDDRAPMLAALQAAIEENVPYNAEYRVPLPDGSLRWLMAAGDVVRDSAGRAQRVIGIVRDTTQRKHAEEALREADRRKDQFLAMLGHELRNPLAPIRNAAELLRLGIQLEPAQVQRAADILIRQVEHVTRLVDDLLDVARINSGRVQLQRVPLDLREVVQRAVEQTCSPPELQQRLRLTLPASPVTVKGDAVRLAQVFSNLLHNACKFSEPEGMVFLELVEEGAEAVVAVRDTGVGIESSLLPRVFDLFIQGEQSLDRTRGGLGLGLTLVRNLVDRHGGRAEVYSAGLGQGSTFTVRLPIWHTPPSQTTSTAVPNQLESRQILIVDDIPDVAESCAMLLRALGHQAQIACDGPQALEMVEQLTPDLILLDIGLPGMDGFEVARRLRATKAGRRARLIAVTGYGQEEKMRRLYNVGFDSHLLKPVGLDVLVTLLAES